jgi:hypothetical protein
MNFLWKKLAAMHHENKQALETNKTVLENAEQEAEIIAAIRARSEEQATNLREANHRNHYSEGLTQSFRGRTA